VRHLPCLQAFGFSISRWRPPRGMGAGHLAMRGRLRGTRLVSIALRARDVGRASHSFTGGGYACADLKPVTSQAFGEMRPHAVRSELLAATPTASHPQPLWVCTQRQF
jgi:hypothetical protein